MRHNDTCVQEMGTRSTSLGEARYIRIYTNQYRALSWTEIWETFIEAYPGQWAIQSFPPEDRVVDEQNIYHLFVLTEPPRGFDIKRGQVEPDSFAKGNPVPAMESYGAVLTQVDRAKVAQAIHAAWSTKRWNDLAPPDQADALREADAALVEISRQLSLVNS